MNKSITVEEYAELIGTKSMTYFGSPKSEQEIKTMNAAQVLTDQQWSEWKEMDEVRRRRLKKFCKHFRKYPECSLRQFASMVGVSYKTLNNKRYKGLVPKGEARYNHRNWMRVYYSRADAYVALERLIIEVPQNGRTPQYKSALWVYYHEFLKKNFPDECTGGVKNSRKIGEVITSAPY